MAAVRVEIDGLVLATVNLVGMHLLNVSVSSSLHDDDAARLEVHGGTYGERESGHRIWAGDKILTLGQSVKVSFLESAGPFDQGQTIREMFPEEEVSEEFDFTVTDAMATELRARPRLRDSFFMKVETSSGKRCAVGSDFQNDQFAFTILWDQSRPLQARISVRTYCFEDVIARQIGNDHLRGSIAVGESATCLVA